MKWDKTLQAIRKGTTKDLGEIMFDPDSYKGEDDQLTIQDNQLSDDQLLDYARRATSLRRLFIEKSKTMSEGEEAQERQVQVDSSLYEVYH